MAGMLAGKLAFVTGAGSGIGRATCRVLSREGAVVIAADRNSLTAEETIKLISEDFKRGHSSLNVEVNKSESVENALQKVLETYKEPPTVIVNCAGILRDNFMVQLSEQDFDEVIDVNLKGTFLVNKIFASALTQKNIKNASIINIASIVGKIGNIGQANYCASKGGVESLTKCAAKELGKFGIRVNAVLPGFIRTPMTDGVPDNVKDKFLQSISVRRFGKPEEVAEVVTFLASDRSSFVNGASIEVTGGM